MLGFNPLLYRILVVVRFKLKGLLFSESDYELKKYHEPIPYYIQSL